MSPLTYLFFSVDFCQKVFLGLGPNHMEAGIHSLIPQIFIELLLTMWRALMGEAVLDKYTRE